SIVYCRVLLKFSIHPRLAAPTAKSTSRLVSITRPALRPDSHVDATSRTFMATSSPALLEHLGRCRFRDLNRLSDINHRILVDRGLELEPLSGLIADRR